MKNFTSFLSEGKMSKAEVEYQSNPKNGQKCINCSMWRDPNKCSAVAGEIDKDGWCNIFNAGVKGSNSRES